MDVRRSLARLGRPWRPGDGLVAVPLAIILVITLVDIRTPQRIHLDPFLVAAPAITASFGGPALTAAVGVVTVLAQVLVEYSQGALTTANHQAQLAALVLISVFVTLFRFALDRHHRQMRRVRSVAVAAQKLLLRPLPRRFGPLLIASVYVAAEEEAQIGGDLYAVVPVAGAVRLVIGDVRGKGLPAVEDAAGLVAAFRGSAYRNLSLPAIAAHLANFTHWNIVHRAEVDDDAAESFVTALVLDIHDDRPCVDMVDCGHPPPLLLRDGTVRTLEVDEPAPPLGLSATSESEYVVETFRFAPGDLLLLYTDGVVEARDRSGGFYPLADQVASWNEADPQVLVDRIHKDLLRHTGGDLGDDAAIVALTRSLAEVGPEAAEVGLEAAEVGPGAAATGSR
ncbi:PP2C family protein-serine/threonine phosphatase [Streptomyces sp. NPDC056835]|uniref:PP2C family protein-serine/threonine phosphatase n=1 Tax=Streptomyces sp. NPDC056835 TaxID=3345956 RepID=UPI0036A87520